MTTAIPASCRRYQDVLLDLAEVQFAAPGVDDALAHLDRCEACERDLAQTAIVVSALRRIRDDMRAAEPGPDAWPRLRARVAARRRPWQPGKLSGLLAGAGLVLVLIVPIVGLRSPAGMGVIGGDGSDGSGGTAPFTDSVGLRIPSRSASAALAAEHGRENLSNDTTGVTTSAGGGAVPRGPQAAAADGLPTPPASSDSGTSPGLAFSSQSTGAGSGLTAH